MTVKNRHATKQLLALAKAENKKDIPEVPAEAKKGLKFAFVKNTDEALKIVLNANTKDAKQRSESTT